MPKQFNIQHVLAGCLKNDPKYQKVLVKQYSGMLYAICFRYLKNVEDARDGLQESLMRIFQNLNKFDCQKASFETWITTITIRICLNKLGKKKIDMVPMDEVLRGQATYDIEASILNGFDAKYLTDLIAELPDGYRTVFNLAAIDDYSHKEIAELLGITVASSRVKLNRAKKVLRERVMKLNKTELWAKRI